MEGKVNGQVTVATPAGKDINIIDDLIYTNPGNKNFVWTDAFDPYDEGFTDKLGLIAGGNVILNQSWKNNWGDMYVMASILAVTGSFYNSQYTRHPQKTLHVYGGIAQDSRGPVGMTNGRGYIKDYKYDQRFFSDPPPHFPAALSDYNTWDVDTWFLNEN